MFSGKTRAAVASGIKDDAATAEKPTYGLVRAAIEVVFKELPDALFDQHLPQLCALRRLRRVVFGNGGDGAPR